MKFRFFLKFITETLKQNPKITSKIILSLFFLSATQACLIFFIKGFLDSFFIVDQTDKYINLLNLLPRKITPTLQSLFFNFNFLVERKHAIFFIPILIAVAASTRAFILLIYSVSQREFSARLTDRARTLVFAKIIEQSYLDLSKRSPAAWMSVVMNDVNFLQDKVTDFLTVFLRGFFIVASSFVALYFLQPETAYSLVAAGIFLVFLGSQVGRRIAFYSDFFQQQIAKMSSHILNVRERFAFIKAQNGESFESKKFHELIQNYYLVMKKSIAIRAAFAPSLEFLGFFLLALFISLQQKNYFAESLNPSNLLPFFVALGLVFKPLKDIGEQFTKLKETLGALSQFERILIKPNSFSAEFLTASDTKPFDLQFSYENNIKFHFEKINLQAGKIVAVIGPSGTGKSTMIRCLAGLLNPIRLDASYVSQMPFLFSGTFRDNLTYGLETKTSDLVILNYLEEFKLSHLLSGLENGLDSVFEALKDRLSGGEKQRLTIVRALLQNKKILLLDEVTAALDSNLETKILENLKSITQKYQLSTLIITHRYENLGLFDSIWKVEDRRLIVEGRRSVKS